MLSATAQARQKRVKRADVCRYERLPHLLDWSATQSAWFGSDGTRQQRRGVTRERKHVSDRFRQRTVRDSGGKVCASQWLDRTRSGT
ncbi:MAG: hypothetical protein WHV66_12600 [Anaerolineales bacterium]